MEKVEHQPNGCWLWTAARFSNGYGAFRDGDLQMRAHRWAYDYFVGAIAPDTLILHTCDVRHCVNPAHLFPGTHKDNMRDMQVKGRAASGIYNGAPRKLTPAEVHEIRRRYATETIRQIDLATEYDVTQGMVSRILAKRAWAAY